MCARLREDVFHPAAPRNVLYCPFQPQSGRAQVFNPASDTLFFLSAGRIEKGPALNIYNIVHFVLDELGLDNRSYQVSKKSVLQLMHKLIAQKFSLKCWSDMERYDFFEA